MKKHKRLFILAGFAAFAVVLVGFWLYQANQPQGITITTQPDYSVDRPLQEMGDVVTIDFAKCKPDVRRFYTSFGSTTVEIKAKDSDICLLNYGGETENPNWDGKLDVACRVPTSLGQVRFFKNSQHLDLSPIDKYCD